MKRTLSIFLSVSASLLAVPVLVLASVVTLNQNVGIVLPSDGTSLTFSSGGTFNKVIVSGGAFELTLDPGDSVTIHDVQKRTLSNSRGIDSICDSGESRITHSLSSSAGTQVVITTTPSGTCASSTVAQSNGGGGGGGGSSSSGSSASSASVVTAITSPVPSISPSVSPTPISSPISSPIPSSVPLVVSPTPINVPSTPPVIILRNLSVGSKGSEVMMLQQFLASDKSIYPEGITNGVFGPKTKSAIQRFQEKYGIAKKGQHGYGVLGPKTRAKVKELSGASSMSSSASQTPTPSSDSSVSALQDQLKVLQDMLKKLQQK